MTEKDILHHKVFCEKWYKINHTPINLEYRLMYMDPINFNHINKDLTVDEIDDLKRLYYFYHRLAVCYKWK